MVGHRLGIGPPHRIESVGRCGHRRQPGGLAVDDGLTRPGDEGSDDRRSLLQGGHQRRVHLLRIPGCEGDHHPRWEVLLQELQRLGIGVGRTVLARLEPGVGADQDEGPERLPQVLMAGRLADPVQACRDVFEGRDERRVGGGRSDVTAVAGHPGHEGPHGVLADPAYGEQPGLGIGHAVVEPGGEGLAEAGDTGRIQQVGRRTHDRTAAHLVEVAQGVAQRTAQGLGLAHRVGARGGDLLGLDPAGVDRPQVRHFRTRLPVEGRQTALAGGQPFREEPGQVTVLFDRLADRHEGIKEELLDGAGGLIDDLLAREPGPEPFGHGLQRLVELRAQVAVTGSV